MIYDTLSSLLCVDKQRKDQLFCSVFRYLLRSGKCVFLLHPLAVVVGSHICDAGLPKGGKAEAEAVGCQHTVNQYSRALRHSLPFRRALRHSLLFRRALRRSIPLTHVLRHSIGCGKSFDTLLMSFKMPCLLRK